ncbi:hypothetical protein SDC9_77413 [bioreactor metagenome]|uniref:DUF7507 domain-containing protein n=1 Tax=bioreactor metagenome TaxID=1076179 RepID=A0A644YQH3_9ZZZZ
MEDSVFGTLSGDADCQVGTVLAVGASCSFETTQFLIGSVASPHNNLFTATVKDSDGNTAENSDDATVTFTDVLPAVTVTKSANPTSVAETGGLVTFTYEVSNSGSVPVTLSSLSDDVFGTLSGDADCQVGTELAVGASCSFDTTETLSGSTSAPHVNTFTAEVEDADGNTASDKDNATVNFTDVLPLLSVSKSSSPISVPESGGDVTFTFTVNNDGTVPLTLTSLIDSVYGSLSGNADCKVGTELAGGASCSFELVKTLSGSIDTTHTNTFTAEGEDSDGNSVSDSDDASVSFTDVAPEIDITKTADPSNVAETGADVTFTFTISNTGLVSETITSLTDDVFGTLDGDADCKVGTELAAGASCSFTLTESLKGAAGTTHTNVATVYAEDAEGNSVNADDDAVVTFMDVLPVITVTKTASPTSILYTGGEVTFTFTVTNSGLVPVTITDLSDDKFGTLTGDEDCEVGTELAPGADCTFEYKTALSGEPDTVHTNTFTATAIDVDENTAEDTDTADVSLLGSAILGVAKELISKTPAAAGTYDVTYQILVKNYGTKDLFKIQVEDDLATTFPAPTLFSVVSVESSDFTVSSTYDGSTDKKLLAGTDSLLVGESGTITLVVNVTPAKVGPFYNSINGSSETSEGTSVTDVSQDGEDPDGKVEEHDDDPTNNSDPTPVSFDTIFNPPLGVKSVDAAAKPVLTWSMSWMNNSNKVPQVAVVHDPIPSKTTYVVDATLIGTGMPADAPLGSTMEGVSCEAGTSTTTITTMCYYEGPTTKNPRGQIIWAGTLGADYGATDPLAAPNAIHIKFATKNLSGTKYVKNVATIDADLNGDGDAEDTGEVKVDSVSATWGTPPSNHNEPVVSDALIIPQTGFAPGSVTALPLQPLQSTYDDLNSLAIEIPALNVKATIVGIPQTDSGWNITWLGDEVGWLNGTAFPTWAGNSVLTGHVYNSNGLPGPFANLSSLKFGDQIIIQAFGQEYIYEVRETKEVSPTDVATLVQHEELPWITLVTCRGYNEASGTYQSRYLVRAVQIKIR